MRAKDPKIVRGHDQHQTVQLALCNQRFVFRFLHPAQPGRAVRTAGTIFRIWRWRRRSQTGGRAVGVRSDRKARFVPGFRTRSFPITAAHAIGQVTKRRQDDGGIVGYAFRNADALNRVYEGHAVRPPMFALLRESLLIEVGFAHGNDRIAGGVEQRDGNQLAGFDEFIGATVDEQIQHRLKPVLHDGSAKTQRPDDGAQGVGDFLGAVAQIHFSRLADPDMFLDLPRDDENPDAQQQSVNQEAVASRLHHHA